MEVHHHTHHPKKWKEYFWEFFMLFLAVFCGFLAELQFEHYVEHQREKKYMVRLYNDLKKDTAFYTGYKQSLTQSYYSLDSIIQMIGDGSYQTSTDQFYNLCLKNRFIRYLEYYNTAFEQMKSSGNLRLIKNERILDSLLSYYYVIEKRAMVTDLRHQEVVTELNKALWGVVDASYYKGGETLEDLKPVRSLFSAQSAKMPTTSPQNILLYKNLCFNRQLTIVSVRNFCIALHKNASNLLMLIKEQYHIDE
ncbi:MAG TPA: hypothetical protein DIW54_11845 [Chitinophagaceae bacterium]|nr:hypothetical protein [Chitinophagaceae bacterium]HCT23970.1 hypothetical protein [Chitinophagaceae bacterium]